MKPILLVGLNMKPVRRLQSKEIIFIVNIYKYFTDLT